MRRLAHIVAIIVAAGLAGCVANGPTAPIDHRKARGTPPDIDYRTASPQGGVAQSRILTPPPPEPVRQSGRRDSSPAVILPERPSSVVIQPGDTLFSLTEQYRLTLEQVIEANDLSPPYTLIVGRTLILPQWPTYTVRPGDTVSEIALAANVDMPSLLLLNYIEDPDNLRAGQVLILPELPDGGLGPQAGGRTPTPSPGGAPAPRAPAVGEAAPDAPAVTSTRQATGTPGRFSWPIQGEIISDFGPKSRGQRNDGVNIRAAAGSPVKAAAGGSVVYSGNELAGYGELILVKHDDGFITAYAHNRRLLVAEGARVQAGQTIAEVGQTGSVNSPQLHFEVRNGVEPVDPMRYLPPA